MRGGFGATAVGVVLLGVTVLGVTVLAGCAATPPGTGTATPTDPASTPTVTATTPVEVVPEFRQPELCAEIITPETAARFAADGMELLGGPEAGPYFAETTAEENAGGITCVWGDESDLASTVVVSVAPVTTATRSDIVSDLIAQGLIETQVDGALTYAQIGDDVSTQALLNVIRTESWISVIEAVGGEDRFQHATELVDEVTGLVYVAP